MSKHRKKPVVIEAVRVTSETMDEVCEFAGVGLLKDGLPETTTKAMDGESLKGVGLLIPTWTGDTMLASPGDWVIRDVAGELRPCNPKAFEKTYEAVDEQKAEGDHAALVEAALNLISHLEEALLDDERFDFQESMDAVRHCIEKTYEAVDDVKA